MSKSLVIGEKPSVANDIARALGNAKRNNGYLETDDFIITSAVGHLVEIYNPDEETADYKTKRKPAAKADKPAAEGSLSGKWSLGRLPVIPDKFALRPTKSTADRVRLISKLLKRPEVEVVINACDAGREGELIFHNLASYLRIDKPIKRLWLQSMTKQAIITGFANLRKAIELSSLREAAVARSEADWLVGINATRALTGLNSKEGGFLLTTAGRVQTPTLAMLVVRERERIAHVAKPYWLLDITCAIAAGTYTARWVRSVGQQPKQATNGIQGRGWIWDGAQARQLAAKLDSATVPRATVEDVSKRRTVAPPPLFDLNSLQREANRRYSLPARRTLQAAQALYERYKLLTYPRTESRHLPPDYMPVAQRILQKFSSAADNAPSQGYVQMSQIAPHCAVAQSRVDKVGKKVFDIAKVTDHFAIIPTGEIPRDTLPELEQKIFDLVCRRFLAVFFPPAELLSTVRTTTVDGEQFETNGSVTLEPGWMNVAMPNKSDKELPALARDEKAQVTQRDLQEKLTKPPARFDDASLLGAMQGAYKLVSEDELSNALQEGGGLGTPATRATIIEELLRHDYVVRDGKELIPTRRAFSLIELLDGMRINMLTKPQLTGEWESYLKRIEQGTESASEFLEGIRTLTRQIATVAKEYDPDATEGDYATLNVMCPRCEQAQISETYRKYECQNRECKFFIWKVIASRLLSPQEAEILLSERQYGPLDDFKSRRGLPFTATIKLEESGKTTFAFPSDQDEEMDFDQLEIIGPCPQCQADVAVAQTSFLCRNRAEGKCSFRLGRIILKRELAIEECAQLLKERKTDVLADFISKRGKPFKARLVLDKNGKLGFEFDKPAAKKPAKKSAKKAAKKSAKKTAG